MGEEDEAKTALLSAVKHLASALGADNDRVLAVRQLIGQQ
jgi:hypothetical protein